MGRNASPGIRTVGLSVVPYMLLKPITFSQKDLKPLKRLLFYFKVELLITMSAVTHPP